MCVKSHLLEDSMYILVNCFSPPGGYDFIMQFELNKHLSCLSPDVEELTN